MKPLILVLAFLALPCLGHAQSTSYQLQSPTTTLELSGGTFDISGLTSADYGPGPSGHNELTLRNSGPSSRSPYREEVGALAEHVVLFATNGAHLHITDLDLDSSQQYIVTAIYDDIDGSAPGQQDTTGHSPSGIEIIPVLK